MTIAIIEGCCGYPATQPGARADLYAGRDASIRGLFGLSGPPGDADYVSPTDGGSHQYLDPRDASGRPQSTVHDNIVDPFAAPDRTKLYVGLGIAALAALGIWYYTR
jgi:hypothetical protein